MGKHRKLDLRASVSRKKDRRHPNFFAHIDKVKSIDYKIGEKNHRFGSTFLGHLDTFVVAFLM